MNKQITEDYCNFEIDKLLKEKGFDGECQGYYEIPTKLSSQKDVRKQLNVLPKNWNEYNKECVVCEYISISTHQMALNWLREVHNVFISSDLDVYSNLYFANVYTQLQCATPNKHYSTELYINPKQAVEAALNYVLKNLI